MLVGQPIVIYIGWYVDQSVNKDRYAGMLVGQSTWIDKSGMFVGWSTCIDRLVCW